MTTSGQPGARRALLWSFGNTAVGKFGTLFISIVIARILGPDELGTYAVALVALAAVLSFNELGVSLAIVRWEEDPSRIAPTVTTISVVTSLAVFVAAWIATPAFAAAMGDPGATGVVRLMLVCVPLNGVAATPAALLQRDYQQGRRAAADQVNIWLGAVLSVSLASVGLGAMSLAVGRAVAAIVFTGMLIRLSPSRLSLGWNREVVRPLLRFGIPLAGSSLVVFAVAYADQLVVGNRLGTQALGFYLLAFNLASWPVTVFSQPIRAVAPAAFARIQHDARLMDRNFRSAFRLVLVLALPACAFLAGAAEPVVTLVYREIWAPAAPALQWLACQAAVRIAFELSYDFLAVKRRSVALMTIQVCWLAALVPALVVGSRHGIVGVAAAQCAVAILVLLVCYGWALHGAGIRLGAMIRTSLVPVAGGTLVWAGSRAAAQGHPQALVAVTTAGVVTLAITGALAWASRTHLHLLRSTDVLEEVPA